MGLDDDRRRHARYLVWLDVLASVEGGEPRACTLVELSAGGALLQMGEAPAAGQGLVIEFLSTPLSPKANARVLRSIEGPGLLVSVEFAAEQPVEVTAHISSVLAQAEAESRPHGRGRRGTRRL